MANTLVMRILKRIGNLFDIGDNGIGRKHRSVWMTLAQCAIWREIHHQERGGAIHASFMHSQNMGVQQWREDPHLLIK